MSNSSQVPSQEQLLLFQPRQARPTWKTLSPEVRNQLTELLTRMFCDRWIQTVRTLRDKETSDE